MKKHSLCGGVAHIGVVGLSIPVLVASGGTLSLSAGCGGGGGSSSGTGAGTTSGTSTASTSGTSTGTGTTTCTGQGGDGGSISMAQRACAATQAATTDTRCTDLPTRFYWEIGDTSGALVSGQGGDADAANIDPTSPMVLASASKWIFGAYALEAMPFEAIVAAKNDVYLNFTSGYHSLDNTLCLLTGTVDGCFTAGNNDRQTGDGGAFFYNGGHLQVYAVNVAPLKDDTRATLADDVEAQVGGLGLKYVSPLPAGGGVAPPSEYAAFLRKVLGGSLQMGHHLGDDQVCAWTHHADCPAIYSPVNESKPGVTTNDVSDEKWSYALAHWVEQDGTFSSPGADGFYPWIDASQTYYGIVARYDPTHVTGTDDAGASASGEDSGPAYFASVQCGRAIRNAWLTGQP